MGRSDEKKRNDQWIPVDEKPPASSEKEDINVWAPPSQAPPAPPAPTKPTAAPAKPFQPSVSPEERAVWVDPVLSPWAKDTKKPTPAPAAPSSTFLGPATTSCPRCNTRITYARNGSPPWEAACTQCGAKGRFWK